MGGQSSYSYRELSLPGIEEEEKEMTTITYRDTGTVSSSHTYQHLAGYARKLVHAWHQWQAAREIESMPFDIRKDIGWPSADSADERKAM